MGALRQKNCTEYVPCYCDKGGLADIVAEQTALVGSVSEEFNCLPVENEEFRRLSEKKALEALKPKRETVFIDKIPGKMLQPRNALPGEKGAFVVSFPLPCLLVLLDLQNTFHSSKQRGQPSPRPRKTKPRVCLKTNCWILSTSASGNTSTGHLRTSRRDCDSPRLISNKLWKWLRIWSKPVTLL